MCQKAALLGAHAGMWELLWEVTSTSQECILVLLLLACALTCRTPSVTVAAADACKVKPN